MSESAELRNLSELTVSFGRGKTPKYVQDSRIHVLNQACVHWDGFHLQNIKYQNIDKFNSNNALALGDVLLNSTGTGTLGRCKVFDIDDDYTYMADSHLTVIKPNMNLILPVVLQYYFYDDNNQMELYRLCVFGSTTQAELSREALGRMKVPVIEMEKQKEFERFVQQSDKSKFIGFKSQFIEMFGDPIQNDMKWPVERLSKIAPQCSPEIEIGDKVWLLNLDMVENDTGNIIDKVLVAPDEIGASTGTFNSDMVLYSKLRPYLNKVVVPDGEGYATNELVAMMPQKNKLRREFLAALLRGDQFLAYAVHVSAGAQMPRMPVKVLKEFNCILPPVELQDAFISFMKQSDKSK